MITGIEAEFCIMKHLKEKSLYFFLRPFFSRGINLFVSRRPSSCYRSQSSFSQGILKSVSWPFLIVQNVFSFVARWGGGQEWGSSALPVGPSLSVSGLLGQEPWEAGGLNNEEPEPRDLAGPPQLALSFIRWSPLSLGKSCLDLQGRTGNLSINTGQWGFKASSLQGGHGAASRCCPLSSEEPRLWEGTCRVGLETYYFWPSGDMIKYKTTDKAYVSGQGWGAEERSQTLNKDQSHL